MIYTYENLFVAYFSINGRFCLVSLKNPTFSNIFPRAKHVLMTFEFERYVHVYLSFRCIFLICSCHLSNHPSILWTILYPSPDDGYYNRNVNVDFTSWYIHLFGLYFFLLPSYCRILSIFTFIFNIYIFHLAVILTLLYRWVCQCAC